MESVGADAVVAPRASWRGGIRVVAARLQPRVQVGRDVRLGRGVVLRARRGGRLVIGAGAAIGDGARLEATGGELRVGPGSAIGDGARLEATGGELRVGPGSALGDRCSLFGAVRIGRECVVGDWARAEGDAQLDDRARLAAHAVALTGARIGRGAVVGSYAVVDGPIAPGAVVERT